MVEAMAFGNYIITSNTCAAKDITNNSEIGKIVRIDSKEELEKELDKKIMFYDAKLDLDKIRKDMEAKGMKVSDEVIYFEIEE